MIICEGCEGRDGEREARSEEEWTRGFGEAGRGRRELPLAGQTLGRSGFGRITRGERWLGKKCKVRLSLAGVVVCED